MPDIVEALTRALGPEIVTPGEAVPERHCQDWAGLPPTRPLALIRPRNRDEVASALALCAAQGVKVVPQGGLTGISGAAHPRADGVVLSLERMNRIRSVDAESGTMVAEAGVVLEVAQTAAAEAGLLLAIDIGARGSCQLGGVIATNAGGHNVVRYGMAREQVLGLEVVLADGTILDDMNALIKNNAGLELRQLFIGSEGLLGVVTACVLKLHPAQPLRETALIGCAGTAEALSLLGAAKATLGPMLTSFEVMWPSFYETMAARCAITPPLDGRHGAYIILEASGTEANPPRAPLERLLEGAFEDGTIADAMLASSLAQAHEFWRIRETPAEYASVIGPIIPFDVSLPASALAAAIGRLEGEIEARWPGAIAMSYGHIGDNNLHLVVHIPADGGEPPDGAVKALVYGIVRDLGGTVSAEHGIGAIKRAYMGHSRTPAQIATMQAIKAALDPRGILNPEKSFDGLPPG
ncbi:FAD-binding oxidoreductase [Acuticoccus sp. MNP-M23]|uniref:FAD-binding oxidoreductase n=1 Tax=Acuticoccus sp. MNP-M23 TaxID=3072793 RepID=UPI002814BD81|nr:FAD-binding oxidoreductase [Acuticoccus sp. MNP-M23]WMS44635.1 FAD-binding oxidoreductase [Acuticoccus sp. MNP-M23]